MLAASSAVILTLGVWLKPAKLPEPTISGEEMLRLQTLTQRRNLENLAVYFSEVAGGIQPGLVWINELGTTGLVWNTEGLIVTAGPERRIDGEITALTFGGNINLEQQIVSESFRAASLRPSPGTPKLQPVRRGSHRELPPGIWIMQMARQAGGNYLFTPGVYGGVATTVCSGTEFQTIQSNIPLTASALGGGLFDVDGNLLAVVLPCDGRFAAFLPEDIDRQLTQAAGFDGQLLRRQGIQATKVDEIANKYFGTPEGAWISAIVDGQPGDAAGLLPGDVITSLDNIPVRSPEDLRPLTLPKEPPLFQLEVRRNRRALRIDLEPSTAQSVNISDPSDGYLVGPITPDSIAARAGLRAGDRLLSVDGRSPQSIAAVRRLFSPAPSTPAFLVLRRGARRFGVFLH